MNENFLDYFELTEEDLEKVNDLHELIDKLNYKDISLNYLGSEYISEFKDIFEFEVGRISLNDILSLITLIEYYYDNYKYHGLSITNINEDFHLSGNKLRFEVYYNLYKYGGRRDGIKK